MKTQSVQESRKSFHEDENTDCQSSPSGKDEIQDDTAIPVLEHETFAEHHQPQNFGQLCSSVGRENLKINKRKMNRKNTQFNLREWAKLRAHKRRYEAVWDTDPSTYSIVWIA